MRHLFLYCALHFVLMLSGCPGSNSGNDSATTSTVPPGEVIGEPVVTGDARASLVAAIAGGGAHMCALLQNGQLRCWGENPWGQLNIHASTNESGKSFDLSGTQFSKMSVSHSHTCGILKGGARDGHPMCFGEQGRALNVPTKKVKDIACGPHFTCFLHEDGKPQCVGEEVQMLGGKKIKAEDFVKYGVDPATGNENQDFSGKAFKNIKAGDDSICAQGDGDDIIYCMGNNHKNMSKSINAKALDYAIERDSVMIIADDGKLQFVGAGQHFFPAKNLADPKALTFRNVVHSFSGNRVLFTGPNNKYDDGSPIPEGTLVIPSFETTIHEDALGYASNRGGVAASNLYAECVLKKNHKIWCRALRVGGKDNPDSAMVKELPKDLAF